MLSQKASCIRSLHSYLQIFAICFVSLLFTINANEIFISYKRIYLLLLSWRICFKLLCFYIFIFFALLFVELVRTVLWILVIIIRVLAILKFISRYMWNWTFVSITVTFPADRSIRSFISKSTTIMPWTRRNSSQVIILSFRNYHTQLMLKSVFISFSYF